MRRVVGDDGVVTIVFGHGEPEVWQRLLGAIDERGPGDDWSWPANTEAGGQQGKANIETTLTMACRPAPRRPASRAEGRRRGRDQGGDQAALPDWERWGLAPADMLMAAAGPAMEVVGPLQRGARRHGRAGRHPHASCRSLGRPSRRRWRSRSTTSRWRPSTREPGSRCGGSGSTAGRSRRSRSCAGRRLRPRLDLDDVRDLVPDARQGRARSSPPASSTAQIDARLGRHRCCARARRGVRGRA